MLPGEVNIPRVVSALQRRLSYASKSSGQNNALSLKPTATQAGARAWYSWNSWKHSRAQRCRTLRSAPRIIDTGSSRSTWPHTDSKSVAVVSRQTRNRALRRRPAAEGAGVPAVLTGAHHRHKAANFHSLGSWKTAARMPALLPHLTMYTTPIHVYTTPCTHAGVCLRDINHTMADGMHHGCPSEVAGGSSRPEMPVTARLLWYGVCGHALARNAPQQAADLHQVRQGLVVSARLRRSRRWRASGALTPLPHCS